MTNEELKYLIDLYFQTRNDLDEIVGERDKTQTEITILNKVKVIVVENIKKQQSSDKHSWKEILNPLLYNKFEDATEKNKTAQKSIAKRNNEIKYLETKLGVIEEMLGEENFKRLQEIERENLIKTLETKYGKL